MDTCRRSVIIIDASVDVPADRALGRLDHTVPFGPLGPDRSDAPLTDRQLFIRGALIA